VAGRLAAALAPGPPLRRRPRDDHHERDESQLSTAPPPGEPSELGDQCFAAFRSGRYDAARDLCLRGLEAGPDANVRGAILYNLGRVAEAQRASALAARYYRRSLDARPGNEVVQRRLDQLVAP
jgi:tetratricopeptide (TPR) repeat protein